MSSDGWFVVVWYDNRQGNDDIFAQLYRANGTKKGSNFKVNSDVSVARQASPDVAVDGRGRLNVAWVDWRNGTYPTNPDIYARRFDTNFAALSIDTKINSDASTRPQKDPAIAADRMGNVAIVFADSTASSWDVMGQLRDGDWNIAVGGFRAHSASDSAQLQPDIALDGRYRYVTWSDKRNGRFDIYTSVVKYNDPHLTATPASLGFTMNAGGPLPESQSMFIEHAGYNSLSYQIIASEPWLAATPLTGQTVDTIAVSLSSLLPAGSYQAELRIIDLVNNDSTLVVPVTVLSQVPSSADSIVLGAISCPPLDSALLPVDVSLSLAMQELIIPLVWDSTLLSIGSIELGESLVGRATAAKKVDQSGRAVVAVTANSGDSIPAGSYEAIRLTVVAAINQGFTTIDSSSIDSFYLRTEAVDGSWSLPQFVAGEVTVSVTTDVYENETPTLYPEIVTRSELPQPL